MSKHDKLARKRAKHDRRTVGQLHRTATKETRQKAVKPNNKNEGLISLVGLR